MAIKKLSSFGAVTSIDGDNDLVPISKYLSPGVYETRNAPANLVGVSNYADLTGTPSIGTNPLDLVQLDATGKLPDVDGSQLKNLPSSLSSPLTTKGDVWTYSTTDARLGVGTNGQVLTANSATSTGLQWSDIPAGLSSPLTTKGDLWGYSTTNARLGVGTNGQVLKANSATSTGLQWGTITSSEVTGLGTAATLNVGTAANNVVQLDATGKLPDVDGSQLKNLPVSAASKLTIASASNGFTLSDITGRLYTSSASGAVTVNLPTSPSPGDWCYFLRISSHAFTIQRSGTQTISFEQYSGETSISINTPNTGLAFAVWTGTYWLFSGDVGVGLPYQQFSATRTNNYTIAQTDHGLWMPFNTNNVTVTLPNGLLVGTQVILDRRGTATVTVTASTTLIGKNVSANSVQIANQYGVVHCVHTGSNIWRITGDL